MVDGLKLNNVTSITLVNNTAKTVDLTPGAGKRWIFLQARYLNPDDVQRNMKVEHWLEAAATNLLSMIQNVHGGGAGSAIEIPNMDFSDNSESGEQNPAPHRIIEGAEMLRFTWAAGGASTGGTDADGLVCQVIETVIGS